MKQIAILSDDLRYIQMIPIFLSENWHIHLLFPYEPVDNISIHQQVKDIPFADLQALVLPIPGLDDSMTITVNEQKHFLPTDIFKQIPSSCIIFTGVETKTLANIALTYHLTIFPFFAADDVAIYNSVPTAEGALQLAMEHTKRTIHQSKLLVFGFGRIGQTVSSLFQAVGALVTVRSNNPSELARASVLQMNTNAITSSADLHTYSIIINTIPAPVITNDMLAKMNPHTLIIDLASSPGGIEANATLAKERQIIHALALPTKVAPQTASEIIAKAILAHLNK